MKMKKWSMLLGSPSFGPYCITIAHLMEGGRGGPREAKGDTTDHQPHSFCQPAISSVIPNIAVPTSKSPDV